MSLNFDLTAIPEDVKTITAQEDRPFDGIKKGDRIMSPVTNALIWSTLATGIGIINDETVDEVVARLDLLQKLDGALLREFDGEDWKPRPITREDVEAHKGLSTNVFPMETRASWVKRHVTNSRDIFPNPEPKRKR